MIISASYRTDIPAFYGDWFLARLTAGHADVRNPYGGRVSRVDLTPGAVTGWVFWTKNLMPFGAALDAVERRGEPALVHYSITGLPRALERSVPDAEHVCADFRKAAARLGARAMVWRYDPIVITDATPADWHRATFGKLAMALEGATDEVATSFMEPYAKTRRNLGALARAGGPAMVLPDPDAKAALARDLSAIAARHGMRLTLCTQPDLADTGLPAAACVNAGRLADVAGRPLTARRRGNRTGCLCAESRDIGAYDTCPHGCVYCYAVRARAAAQAGHRAHDPTAAMLRP